MQFDDPMSPLPRLRLDDVRIATVDGERCRARVSLTGRDGEPRSAEWEGAASPAGRLRAVAEATLAALRQHTATALSIELLGVKSIKAFDNTLVVASAMVRWGGNAERVVGSCIQPIENPRGAALAVLDATNRLVGYNLQKAMTS